MTDLPTDANPHEPGPRAPVPGLARGSSPWLAPAWGVAAASLLATRRSRKWATVALPATGLAAVMTWFFRDPERVPGHGRVLSAADGVIQSIDACPDGRTRVATFMSPLNVHVNRAPVAGVVTSRLRRPGGYRPAFDKDSEHNERVVWHFDTEFGDVEMVQIAGAMARRIIPYTTPGEKVTQAERIGLIRFGSRVDIYLPVGIAPAVRVGQRVEAGRTRFDRD